MEMNKIWNSNKFRQIAGDIGGVSFGVFIIVGIYKLVIRDIVGLTGVIHYLLLGTLISFGISIFTSLISLVVISLSAKHGSFNKPPLVIVLSLASVLFHILLLVFALNRFI